MLLGGKLSNADIFRFCVAKIQADSGDLDHLDPNFYRDHCKTTHGSENRNQQINLKQLYHSKKTC